MDGIGNIAVAMIRVSEKYSEIPQLSEIMLTENMVLPDYVCLDDVVINHPELKLLIDSQTNANQISDKADKEIQQLLDNLAGSFLIGIKLFNSH